MSHNAISHNMKRIFTLILLAGAMLAGTANAQTKTQDRWIKIGASADYKTTLYFDRQNIHRDGDTVVVWEKFAEDSGEFWLMRTQIRRDRQYRTLSYFEYDAKGKVIFRWMTPDEWAEAVPESLQEAANAWFDLLMAIARVSIPGVPLPSAHF